MNKQTFYTVYEPNTDSYLKTNGTRTSYPQNAEWFTNVDKAQERLDERRREDLKRNLHLRQHSLTSQSFF